MRVLSTNTGMVQPVSFQGTNKMSSMNRQPSPQGIELTAAGVTGDSFDELKYHGTRDNRLYALGAQTHREFAQRLGAPGPYPAGAFGENLTMDILDESTIFMGDQFRIWEAVVQATFPRIPCVKLNFRFQSTKALITFRDVGRPGVYFRVIKPGRIRPSDEMELLSQEAYRISIKRLFVCLLKQDQLTKAEIEGIKTVSSTPEAVRTRLLSV